MNSSYAILVVTCNGLPLTKLCIESIWHLRKDVLIVDNGSTDGTQAYLRSLSWSPIVLANFHSLAETWNHGLSWAFRHYPYVLVLNNDTEILPDMGQTLVQQFYEWDGVGIASGISVREQQEMYVPKEITTPSPHPDFSCFMLSKACYESVGPFDEQYHGAYCEDCDYHVRMHRRGWKAVSINYPFLHHASGTLKYSDPDRQETIRRHADTNRQIFRAKWGVNIGTPEYDTLFTPALFGVERVVREQPILRG